MKLYKSVIEFVGDKVGPERGALDQSWMDRAQEQAEKTLEKLEVCWARAGRSLR